MGGCRTLPPPSLGAPEEARSNGNTAHAGRGVGVVLSVEVNMTEAVWEDLSLRWGRRRKVDV